MLGICIFHLYPITLWCLLVERGQIANFGEKIPQGHLTIIQEILIIPHLVHFIRIPPLPPSLLQLSTKE